MAGATDYFQLVGNETATNLASPFTAGGNTVVVNSTANWPTTTGVIFAIDSITMNGTEEVQTAGTYTLYQGRVTNGTTISDVSLISESPNSAQNYAAGSLTRVYMPASAGQWNRAMTGLQVAHDQDGTLKAGAVDNAAVLASDVVETAKIKDKNVTLAKINGGSTAGVLVTDASGNVSSVVPTLGYAEITSNFTTSSTTAVQVTGLTVTVTIPSGGRKVKVSVWGDYLDNSTSSAIVTASLWDGTVGSGTKLAQVEPMFGTTTRQIPCTIFSIKTPAAGSKTYNVGLQTTGGTGVLGAASTSPAFILVELI